MDKVGNKKFIFSMVAGLIGFMLAVQFQTVHEPEQRDTRDEWELKQDLLSEQKVQAGLLTEITKLEHQLSKYESEQQESKEKILKETLDELKEEAGLADTKGQGIILRIEPIEDVFGLNRVPDLSPELLKRLMNELNRYGAGQIAIGDNRIVNSTVIRDINGITKVDGNSIEEYPLEIRVLAKEADKLKDKLKASQLAEDFFLEDFSFSISNIHPSITVPGYDGEIRTPLLKAAD